MEKSPETRALLLSTSTQLHFHLNKQVEYRCFTKQILIGTTCCETFFFLKPLYLNRLVALNKHLFFLQITSENETKQRSLFLTHALYWTNIYPSKTNRTAICSSLFTTNKKKRPKCDATVSANTAFLVFLSK